MMASKTFATAGGDSKLEISKCRRECYRHLRGLAVALARWETNAASKFPALGLGLSRMDLQRGIASITRCPRR